MPDLPRVSLFGGEYRFLAFRRTTVKRSAEGRYERETSIS